MPSTTTPSPAHPVRPLCSRDPLPDTIARPQIRLAWKEEPALPALGAAPVEAEPAAPARSAAAPEGAVGRLLTMLAARLITNA